MLELLFLLLPVAAAYGWFMGRNSEKQKELKGRASVTKNLSSGLIGGVPIWLSSSNEHEPIIWLPTIPPRIAKYVRIPRLPGKTLTTDPAGTKIARNISCSRPSTCTDAGAPVTETTSSESVTNSKLDLSDSITQALGKFPISRFANWCDF